MLIVFEFSLCFVFFDMFYSILQETHRQLFAYVSIHLSNQPSINFTMNHNIISMLETELQTEIHCDIGITQTHCDYRTMYFNRTIEIEAITQANKKHFNFLIYSNLSAIKERATLNVNVQKNTPPRPKCGFSAEYANLPCDMF